MRLKILPAAISIICFVIFTTPIAPVHGQTSESRKTSIVYDPLFWKGKLKLDAYQCKRIREINSKYYENLLTSVKEESNSSLRQRKASETLLERSEEIWETFYPKQRKRWKKLWNGNSSCWTIAKKEKTIEHL